MIPVEDLQKQHRAINSLCEVLLVLLEHETARSTPLFHELCERFKEMVRDHLAVEDHTLYPELLHRPEAEVRHVARQFLGGSHELRRIFTEYLKEQKKFQQGDSCQDVGKFVAQARETILLLQERIEIEEEQFLPMLRNLVAME